MLVLKTKNKTPQPLQHWMYKYTRLICTTLDPVSPAPFFACLSKSGEILSIFCWVFLPKLTQFNFDKDIFCEILDRHLVEDLIVIWTGLEQYAVLKVKYLVKNRIIIYLHGSHFLSKGAWKQGNVNSQHSPSLRTESILLNFIRGVRLTVHFW